MGGAAAESIAKSKGLHGWILPAKYTALRTERPVALVSYHMEKTGGSAVMKWLYKGVMNRPATLTLLLDLTHTSCLLAMFPDLFPGYKWEPLRCSAEQPPDWRSSAIAIVSREGLQPTAF